MSKMETIKNYRNQGLTWPQVGVLLGTSHQAAHAYYHKYTNPHKIRVKHQDYPGYPVKIYVNKDRLTERELINCGKLKELQRPTLQGGGLL